MIDINVTHGKHEFKVIIDKEHITDVELIKDAIEKLVKIRLGHKASDEDIKEIQKLAIEQFNRQF